jgi:hypothetical protein
MERCNLPRTADSEGNLSPKSTYKNMAPEEYYR